MFAYLIRRILYAIPILIGVNLITFALFFLVNTPDSMARAHLGDRHVTQVAIDRWKKERGYDKPLFFNTKESGIKKITDTLFFKKSLGLFYFFVLAVRTRDMISVTTLVNACGRA